ncbi:MAG: flagellar hook-basal body complex protein FliE [Firmicutes bacterium]|nr:flagellar hook-basal body complex protein FliE [Bacillota bacterium]
MQNLSIAVPIKSGSSALEAAGNQGRVGQLTSSFADYLHQAIQEVSNLQKEADLTAAQLATGEIKDIHQAMIAAEKASLTLQLTIQIRNKVLDAYHEIMRMQV